MPCRPVLGVDDHVGVTRCSAGQPLAVGVAQLGQALPRRGQTTGPVEELQKIRQAFELEQALPRPWHGHARLRRPLLENTRLETAFERGMHLRLRQGTQSVHGLGRHIGHRGFSSEGTAKCDAQVSRTGSPNVIRALEYPKYLRPTGAPSSTRTPLSGWHSPTRPAWTPARKLAL